MGVELHPLDEMEHDDVPMSFSELLLHLIFFEHLDVVAS